MKATLIKRVNKFEGVHYILKDEKDWITASTLTKEPGLALSLKNCQSIERGYDLDDLADTYGLFIGVKTHRKVNDEDFIAGFETAIELMGDKKFSYEDMEKVFVLGVNSKTELHARDKAIQSIQQTEWDVEIVMGGYRLNDDGEKIGFPSYELPKLDADGCLILKRI